MSNRQHGIRNDLVQRLVTLLFLQHSRQCVRTLQEYSEFCRFMYYLIIIIVS